MIAAIPDITTVVPVLTVGVGLGVGLGVDLGVGTGVGAGVGAMVGMAVEVGVAVGATVGVSVGVGVGECVGAAADELHPAVVSASSNAPVASKRHLMIETPPRKSGRRPNRGER
jgi:hypothetical protein